MCLLHGKDSHVSVNVPAPRATCQFDGQPCNSRSSLLRHRRETWSAHGLHCHCQKPTPQKHKQVGSLLALVPLAATTFRVAVRFCAPDRPGRILLPTELLPRAMNCPCADLPVPESLGCFRPSRDFRRRDPNDPEKLVEFCIWWCFSVSSLAESRPCRTIEKRLLLLVLWKQSHKTSSPLPFLLKASLPLFLEEPGFLLRLHAEDQTNLFG